MKEFKAHTTIDKLNNPSSFTTLPPGSQNGENISEYFGNTINWWSITLDTYYVLTVSSLALYNDCFICPHSSNFPPQLLMILSYITPKKEVVRNELSHFSMINTTHLCGPANLFPLVSNFLPIEGPFLIPVQFPPFTLSKISLLWLTSPLSAYIFITFPSYCIIPIVYKHAPSSG